MSVIFFELNNYKVITSGTFGAYISQPNGDSAYPDTRISTEHDEVSRYIKNRFKRKASPEELRDALKDWFSDESVEVNGFLVSKCRSSKGSDDVCWKSPVLGKGWSPTALLDSHEKLDKCETTVYLKKLFNGRPSVRIAEVVQAIKEFSMQKPPTLQEFTDAVNLKIEHCGVGKDAVRQVLAVMWPEQAKEMSNATNWFIYYNWLINNWNPPVKRTVYQVNTKLWETVNLLLDMNKTDSDLTGNIVKIIDVVNTAYTAISRNEADRLIRYAAHKRGFLIGEKTINVDGSSYTYNQVELKLV